MVFYVFYSLLLIYFVLEILKNDSDEKNINAYCYKKKTTVIIEFVILSMFISLLYFLTSASSLPTIYISDKDSTIITSIVNNSILWKILWIMSSIYISYSYVVGKKSDKTNLRILLKYIISASILLASMEYTVYAANLNYICSTDGTSIHHFISNNPWYLTLQFYLALEQTIFYIFVYGSRVFRLFIYKTDQVKTSKITQIIFLIVTPCLSFLFCEMSTNVTYNNIAIKYVVLGLCVSYLFECFFVLLPWGKKIGMIVLMIIYWSLGTVNSYLLLFRGTPLIMSDFTSLTTAENVAGEYSIVPNDAIFVSFIFMLLYISILNSCFCWKHIEIERLKKERVKKQIALCVTIAIMINWLYFANWSSLYGLVIGWKPEEQYAAYGFMTAFIESGKMTQNIKPSDYSSETVREILSKYQNEPQITETNIQPTIICIMNEAFTDLSVLGKIECVNDDLKYFKSLKNDEHIIEYGYSYSSVCGGGTANTEFEALTGDTTAFLENIFPYNVFNFDGISTYPSILKEIGYDTIAMHPCVASNYNRKENYKRMKFDQFLSDQDFVGQEFIRNWCSDNGDYSKLIDEYEKNMYEKNPQFIFNVTIQNHSPYDLADLSDSMIDISTVDTEYQQYSDLVCYETLLHQSDLALKNLLTYFSNVDSPVLICFFGDHQPRMNSDFLSQITGENTTNTITLSDTQNRFAVPYFIWSNYDVNSDSTNIHSFNGVNVTSPQYICASIASYSGQGITPYYQYLLDMKKEIPAINANGYMDSEGTWNELSQYNDMVHMYNLIEYNHLFEKNKNQDLFK